jgi:serine/threonine protein phosphatase PrpC
MASDDRHPRIRQRSAVLTDVGVIREHNEDSAYADPQGDFFIVADGMGGHAAGEVASNMAVEAVKKSLEGSREDIAAFARSPSDEGRRALVSVLENAVRQAHQAVFERGAKESDKQGMGTTLDVVLIAGSEAFVAHVGDSRTYLVRDSRAAQITTDHTVAEVLVIEGKLSIEEAQVSPLRTILVNAIGVAPDVGVEMAHVRLKRGDRLLLCSDGLHDYFPLEQEVSEYVSEYEPSEALSRMITLAKGRGGHDNITGIVLEVIETPTPSDGVVQDDEDIGDFDAGLRPGLEDTGSMPALPPESDAATPDEEFGRDDTMPVELRPTTTSTPPPIGESNTRTESGGKTSKDAAGDDDSDIRETQRLKPLSPKKKKRKKRTSKADGPDDPAGLEDTGEQPSSDDSAPSADDGADEASRD